MHGREARDEVMKGAINPKDMRTVLVDGRPALEYDGLHLGELAWILGRRFKAVAPADGSAGVGDRLNDMSTSMRYAHQANMGMGTGVDRMQRLASQPWIESMVMNKLGTTVVHLHAIQPDTSYATMMDSSLFELRSLLAGSTALHVNDVTRMAQARAQIPVGQRVVEQKQGIMLYETGPFLRGMQFDTNAIQIPEPSISDPFTYSGGTLGRTYAMPRNAGDNCAFAALNTELRRRNIFDWTPDGIVLSKLESPTDEPMKSSELDAREAQLFNVAVQGPAISTTWTSDIRDHKLQCQPMDRVFVCLIAELSVDGGNAEVTEKLKERDTKTDELLVLYDALEKARRSGKDASAVMTQIQTTVGVLEGLGVQIAAQGSGDDKLTNAEVYQAMFRELHQNYNEALNEYKSVESLEEPSAVKAEKKAQLAQARADLTSRTSAYNFGFAWPTDAEEFAKEISKVSTLQNQARRDEFHVGRAVLTNFRYMRTTSAHLANYSYFNPASASSRCGLRFGKVETNGRHTAEYIVGAWCIGTVIDSAASRSHVGQMIRTSATSMALNVNVNVEWWSGDKLYKHYMDTSGLVMRRGQAQPLGEGVEVPAADLGFTEAEGNAYLKKRKEMRNMPREMGPANKDMRTAKGEQAKADLDEELKQQASAAALAAAKAQEAREKATAETIQKAMAERAKKKGVEAPPPPGAPLSPGSDDEGEGVPGPPPGPPPGAPAKGSAAGSRSGLQGLVLPSTSSSERRGRK